MWPLRLATSSQEIPLGVFVDSVDGNTAEGGLTIANTDIKLQKNGATSQVNKNSGGATHIATGDYYAVLDATDTDTLGPMRVKVHVAGALAVWLDCCVYPAVVYDALFAGSGDGIRADVRSLAGVAQSLTDLKDFADDGYDPGTNKVQGVVLTDTLTTYTGNTPQTGDVFPLASTEIADIKAKTDQLTFSVANRVDSTTQSGVSTLDAAGVRSAVGLGAANLDTQLDALPTNAELATALAAADDAVLSAVAALNNITVAAVAAQITADHGAGSYQTATGFATAAEQVKVVAAVYNTATRVGNVITLSNGATQTIGVGGRVTA